MSLFLESVFASLVASIIFERGERAIAIWYVNKPINYWLRKCFERAVKRYCKNISIADKMEFKYIEYCKHLRNQLFEDSINTLNKEQYELCQLFENEVRRHFVLRWWLESQQNKYTKERLKEVLLTINTLICNDKKILKEVSFIKQMTNRIGEKLGLELIEFVDGENTSYTSETSPYLAARVDVIQNIIRESNKGRCILVKGTKGIGKSTLLSLIAQKLYKENIGCRLLNLEYKIDCNLRHELNHINFKDCIYVLIDSLDLSPGSVLNKNIDYLLELKKSGLNVIISSYQDLPAEFISANIDDLLEVTIPPLSENDITEILNNYKGNPVLAKTVYIFSSGHPIVVKALCLYLKQNNWSVDGNVFGDIVTFNFSRNIQQSLASILIKMIPDALTRELLNRLLLVIGDITEDYIDIVANINPPINEARSKFQTLKPLFLEQNVSGGYKITPLLKNIWKPDLLLRVKKEVNSVLGHMIIDTHRKSFNQKQLSSAIIYLINGDEVDLAGFLYLKYLIFISENVNSYQKNDSINLFWIDVPLPENMSDEIKLSIRACQSIIYHNKIEERRYVLDDLIRLLHNADILTGKKALFYRWIAAVSLTHENISVSLDYYKKSIELGPPEIDGVDLSDIMKLAAESGIWIMLSRIRTVADFNSWIYLYNRSGVLDLQPEDILMCISFVDMYAYDRLVVCDIHQLKVELYEMLNSCKENSIEILITLFTCKLIYAEGIDSQINKSMSLYEDCIDSYQDNDIASFLLNKAVGDTYYIIDNGINKDIIYEYYSKALTGDLNDTLIELKINTLLKLSSVSDVGECLDCVNKAYLLYEKDGDLPQYIKSNIIGEHSIALWKNNNKIDAICKISDGYKNLVIKKFDDSEELKTLLVLYEECLRYYYFDIEGKPIDENLIIPYSGLFLRSRESLMDLYTEEKKLTFAQMLFSIFDKQELCVEAKFWMRFILKSKESVPEFGHTGIFLSYMPYLLIDNDYNQIAMLFYDIRQWTIEHKKTNPNFTIQTDYDYLRLYILPCIIKALTEYLINKENGIVQLSEIYNIVLNHKAFASSNELIDIFAGYIKKFIDNESLDKSAIFEVNKLDIQNTYSIHCLVYLLVSIGSNPKYAFELQMAFIPKFEDNFRELFGWSTYLWLTPFFELFWDMQRQMNSKDFNSFDHLQNKGISLINSKNSQDKLNTIFRIHLNHINNITLNSCQERWCELGS